MRDERPVVLLWGDDEYLLRLAAVELLKGRGARIDEIEGAAWQGGELADLATPSLLGEKRSLLITHCQSLPEAGARELRRYLEAPAPEAVLVLTVVSRARQAPAPAKLVESAGGEVRHVSVRPPELPRWVTQRGRLRGVRIDSPAAAALTEIVGVDTAALDQAVEQLASAFPGRPVGMEEVRAQFRGLGEHRTWDLCDHAFSGRSSQALVVLRALLDARDDPLLILGGIASRIRELLRVRGLPARLPEAKAVREAGVRFGWQLRKYREQAGRFAPEDLIAIHDRAVEADRALKGGMAGDVILAALVLAIAGEREASLDVPVRVSR